MHGQDGGDPARARRRSWLPRLLAAVLVLAAIAGAGPPSRLPSPQLQLTSTTDPAPPTNVTATGADRALVVSWTASNEALITRYDVFLDGSAVRAASSTTTSATVPGLVNGRQYLVTVKTVTNVLGVEYVGSTASSPPAPGTPRDTVAPAAPTGVATARGDGRVDVSWVANSGDYDADGYRVLRNGVVASPVLTGRATTSWTDTGVVNETTYGYTVQTRDTSGNWSVSSSPVVSATPTDLTAPSAPTGVVGGRGDGRAGLSWNANPEPDLASYRVLRDGVEVATVTATSYLDLGLTNDTTYSYAIVAVDTHGNRSSASAAVLVTPTDLTPPAAPTGLTAVRGDAQVTLSWTASPEPDLADYRVLRDGVEVATVTGTTHVDTGLVNDTRYTYTLVAVDTHGNRSVSSSPVDATPTDLGAPAPPTGLTAVRGDQQVALSWTANVESDLANYRLMRDGLEIAVILAGTTTYVDAGLANDTTYTYTLAALDRHGNRSPDSAPVTARPTDLTAPAAPTGLTAVRGDGRVSLSWTASSESDLANYRVLRDGVEVATVTGTSHVDTGLTNDVTYTYRLVAVDTHGNRSTSSSPVTATPTDLTAPAVPTGLTAVRGDGRVSLSWTANAESDLADYRLMRNGVEIAVVAAGTTSSVDAGLTNDTTYSYTLAAVDTHGNRSADSAPVLATPTDLTAPAAPTGVVAGKSSGVVTVSWTANTEPDLANYRVLRNGVEIATVTGTSFSEAEPDGVSRSYAIVAVDTHGNRSAPSASVRSDGDTTPPAAPTGLTATRGDGSVGLTWTANTEPDLATYRVLRGGVEIATVTGTSYTDPGRTNDVTYTYTLVAVDSSGNRSAESAPASATPTDLTAPSAPTGLVATAGENQVTLSWTANPEPDVASYRVLRSGVEIATVTGTTGYTDTARTNGVTYTYTLVAVDGHGNRSTESAPASATPVDGPPAAPTGVAATPGDRRAGVSWTAPPDPDVVSYRVRAEDGSTAATATAPTTSAAVAGLTNGTAYRFTVVAVDAGGNVSAASGSVTVTPASPAVPATGAGESGGMAASADGRFVVTGTKAQREASDTNTAYELYLVDRTGGTSRRIAPLPASATGATDPTNTAAPAISDDGRYVALVTTAALLATDTNGLADVYRLDTSTGTWSFVSEPATGGESPTTAGAVLQTGSSVYATSPPVVLSADGDLVLFYSARTDLVTGDTNGVVDVFAKRMSTGVVTRVSTTAAGGNLGGAATGPALAVTPDGRFALFPAATGSGTLLLYRKTLSGTGTGDLVVVSSVRVNGITTQFPVYRDAGDIAISDDGSFVGLVTAARITSATPGTLGSTGLAYRKDLSTGSVLAMGSGQQTVLEHRVELDPTGRYGFFGTAAAALPADTNGHTDFYRRDLDGGIAGPLVLVTSDAGGAATTGPVGSITSSEYGRLFAASGDRVLVLTSQALVSADTNQLRDLYAKDLTSGVAGSPLG